MSQSFSRALDETGYNSEYRRSFDGIDLYMRKTTVPSQQKAILCVVGSIWLPVPSDSVFDFLTDENRREEWDILSFGNPMREVSHIPTGTDVGNRISILKPVYEDGSMLFLQETSKNPLGSNIVYTSIEEPKMEEVARGGDSSQIPICPSGLMIAGNGSNGRSLLTLCFQLFTLPEGELSMESVEALHELFTTTVEEIKSALNCL